MTKRIAKKSGGQSAASASPLATNDRNALSLEGKSQERVAAEVGFSPVVSSSQTACLFAKGVLGTDIPKGEAIAVMADIADKVKAGDLGIIETTLAAQATTLDAIFNELARRSAANLGEHPNVAERYLRLALKAQAQSRTTLQALSDIKNPRPVAFVNQANIAHGHQQVVNTGVTMGAEPPTE